MNQETLKFCLHRNENDKLTVDVEGSAGDLTNLIASAIDSDPDLEMVVTLALMAVTAKRNNAGDSMDALVEMFSKSRPTAQA